MSLRITLAHQFEQQKEETWALAFAQDGQQLISSDGSALYLWRINADRNWDYEKSLSFQYATFPRFAPDGKMLAFGGSKEFIKLISVDGDEIATLPSPSHADWAFSPDQRWLVSSSTKREILLWDLVTYQNASISIPFPAFDRRGQDTDLSNEGVGSFLFTPDGQRLLFGVSSAEGYIHICLFDPEHRRIMRQATFPASGMLDGMISPNGKMLAMVVPNEQSSVYKQDIYVYNLETFQLLHIFPQGSGTRYCLVVFSPDSQYLMSCKSDGWVDIFSLSSLECVAQFAAHPGLSSHATDPIGGLDWSSTGYIATGGASVFEKDMKKTDYTIKIWRVEEE